MSVHELTKQPHELARIPAPARAPTAQRKCACGGTPGPDGECAACKAKRLARASATASAPAGASSVAQAAPQTGHHFGQVQVTGNIDEMREYEMPPGDFGEIAQAATMRLVNQFTGQPGIRHSINKTSEGPGAPSAQAESLEGGTLVGQAGGGTTPDGNALGPTDRTKRACLVPNSFQFRGRVGSNTAAAATGNSRVTFRLQPPGPGHTDCDCGCALFRQFIRGFWRRGAPGSAKRFDTSSCGNPLVMNERTFVEEFESCNPGGSPLGPDCDRAYLDEPGFGAGLADGTFIQVHLDLRYQVWDRCQGRSLGVADHALRISGDRAPRTITFR